MPGPWDLLAARMADLRALQGAVAVLSWDHETHMPPKGGAARAEQLATLQGLRHERLTAPDLGDALAAAEAAERAAPDVTRAALLRALRFERDRALAVPERLVRETAAAQTASVSAWRGARERSDFAAFAPHLEELLALRREAAEHLLPTLAAPDGGGAAPLLYDALLEGHEPGMRVARLEPLFRRLSGWLAPLADRLTALGPPEDPFAGQRFDADAQWAFTVELLEAMGFDLAAGRQDRSTHPFTEGIDPGDVRLTNRVDPALPLSAVFSALHEGGHGLYEQGLPAEHRRDLLCAAPSMGLHESQSRLWENLVGRSRPFWSHFLPRLAARFPAAAGVPLDRFLRAVNGVARSLVRVEADEVTYNLHVVLRFELEVALVGRDLRVRDLPAAWNERSARLLGATPRHDAEGVLQDIHWSFGEFGYFPTYAIGNLYAATLFAAARRALPDLDDHLARGGLAPLGAWLREHVHRLGRTLPAEDIVRRASGRGLDDEDFRAYLEAKYAAGPSNDPSLRSR